MKHLILIVALTVASALTLSGCNDGQVATAQADIQKIQAAYNATTQAAADAKLELDAARSQLSIARSSVATMPAGPEKDQALAATDKMAVVADASEKQLATILSKQDQIQAALTVAANIAASMHTNAQAPDVSPLAALGPYGQIAAIGIPLVWGLFNQMKNGQLGQQVQTLASTVTAQTGSIALHKAALVASTGTDHPLLALANAEPPDKATAAVLAAAITNGPHA